MRLTFALDDIDPVTGGGTGFMPATHRDGPLVGPAVSMPDWANTVADSGVDVGVNLEGSTQMFGKEPVCRGRCRGSQFPSGGCGIYAYICTLKPEEVGHRGVHDPVARPPRQLSRTSSSDWVANKLAFDGPINRLGPLN